MPSVQLDKKTNSIRVRYFDASSVSEHVIPSKQLLSVDPKSGHNVSNGLTSLPELISIETIGHYGVGIRWSDKYEIFSFDAINYIVNQHK